MKTALPLWCLLITVSTASASDATPVVLDSKLHHLRNGAEREWQEFPETAEATQYELRFDAAASETECSLRLVQQDVKQSWNIQLNGKPLGRLHRDENSISGFWVIPPKTLLVGANVLTVTTDSKSVDDIRVGKAVLYRRPLSEVTGFGSARVTVRDEASKEIVPCRISVISAEGLVTVGAESGATMAVRPGVIYCLGKAEIGLPPGPVRIVAGRGPEYSIATHLLNPVAGKTQDVQLTIRRQVPTNGFVACDTHVHTLTHSGHGDATVRERMLTLAGEALELPIATDHNIHVNYESLATEMDVRQYFTPVIGNEVTTKLGHFNVFPVATENTAIPDHAAANWPEIFSSIFATPNVKVAILNHARDVHSGFRPFGPDHHLASVGQNLDGWQLDANAMEVVNSAAQQTDMMRLVHDWMGLLNSGKRLTPVGSSDSHDVARHFVGQGRTYIRCDDSNVGAINVEEAVAGFLAGRVCVSCGLLADVKINGSSGIGDTVEAAANYQMEVFVKGPSWIEAHEVEIFVNGVSVQKQNVPKPDRAKPGLKCVLTFELPVKSQQDAFVVAVVRGPGVTDLYWPIAKPYQPTSTEWSPQCMAVTGAIWIDADGDGSFSCAKQYAERLMNSTSSLSGAITELRQFDTSVALQLAALIMSEQEDDFVSKVLPLARKSSPETGSAFETYFDEWQQSQRARAATAHPHKS